MGGWVDARSGQSFVARVIARAPASTTIEIGLMGHRYRVHDRRMRGWMVVVIVLATARAADAGAWYYKWSCTGACAPNQLSIRGVEGPFASESMCTDARWGDSRRFQVALLGRNGALFW